MLNISPTTSTYITFANLVIFCNINFFGPSSFQMIDSIFLEVYWESIAVIAANNGTILIVIVIKTTFQNF